MTEIVKASDSTREERLFAAAIRAALDKIRSATVRADVADALATGNYRRALDAIDWAEGAEFLRRALPRQMRDIFESAGEAALDKLRISGAFDITNPRSIDFVRRAAGELITEFVDSSREAVAFVIEQLFERGIPPARGARMLLDAGIGLTRRLARAVDNQRARMIEDGMAPGKADQRAAAYAARLERYRAENIARTEVIRAAREGEQESWRQAADRGLIDTTKTVQVWLATNDRRKDGGTCELCFGLDGQSAPLGQRFVVPETGVRVSGPPLHPSCRCSLYLRKA